MFVKRSERGAKRGEYRGRVQTGERAPRQALPPLEVAENDGIPLDMKDGLGRKETEGKQLKIVAESIPVAHSCSVMKPASSQSI